MKNSFETFAPLFNGFYCTVWDLDQNGEIESELEYINEQRDKKGLPPVDSDQLQINYKGYHLAFCEKFCDWLHSELSYEFESIEIDFQSLQSPRFYNFSTDSINCEVKLLNEDLQKIREIIYNNRSEFESWIKDHFSSCDGFISFFSNDFNVWKAETNDFFNYPEDKQYFGHVLQFVLSECLGMSEFDFYDYKELYISEFIENFDELTEALQTSAA
ncbi:hypothetical protein [uncultured Draconibacterium sp.]|uniref:hypothetical protein n=1 Tax=uncultured Draconibacterium sp. TaxID=1573823 RepID=UPI0025FBAE17|nr:hypothetical protein [uncultured Draconibacterium sp.]